MSKVLSVGNFGRFSHFKKIVESGGEIYTVSGITRPEFIYGLTPFIKYEIMVFNKDKVSIYEEYFCENEYNEFMEKCGNLAVNLENYLRG